MNLIDLIPIMPLGFVFIPALIMAAVSAAGAGMSYMAQRSQAKAAESVAARNAQIQRRQAEQESKVSAENVRRKQRDNSRQIAALRASTAARGLKMEGSPIAVLNDTAMTLDRDIQDIAFAATNKVQALSMGADQTLWEGKMKSNALKTSATSSLIGGLANAGMGYLTASGAQPQKNRPTSTS